MTIYKNQHKPWQPGVNQTNELYHLESKELIWDIEGLFKVDNRVCGCVDNLPFVAGENVCNQVILGCDEYEDDIYRIDMILRGDV
jgi:hypothetical protein